MLGWKVLNINVLDQYHYLDNCPPTPPLTQQQSIDNKFRLMLGQGRGRWAVAQILILIQYSYIFSLWLGNLVHLLFHRGSLSLYETCSGTEQCGAFIGSKKASWHSTNRYRVKEICETLTTMLLALMTLMEVVRKSLLPVFTILSSYP